MSDQERYYNVNKLHRYFAVSSVVMLVVVIWTFVDDYSREWKQYQREFRTLEVTKTEELYQQQSKQVADNSEYQKLQVDKQAAWQEFQQQSEAFAKLQQQRSEITAQEYLQNQNYQFAKAQLDVAKFHYEEALGKNGDVTATQKTYEIWQQRAETLLQEWQETQMLLKDKDQKIAELLSTVKKLQEKSRKFDRDLENLQRKLQKLNPQRMSWGNQLGNKIRDLPVIDFLNPYYKVEQIILPDIHDELNFTTSPRVDRCTTCHQGMTKEQFSQDSQPYRSHPRLDLFLASNSPHPMEDFGCTSCHEGRSRGTGFTSSAHTPHSQEQRQQWQQQHQWHRLEHWETPMYSKQHLEAGCFKCHQNQTYITGAENLNRGLLLIERAGCYGCHAVEKYQDWGKRGPNLHNIAHKTTADWTYLWIRNPKSFRHNTWMPNFFAQSNNKDLESTKRTNQEIHAMVHYLFQQKTQDYTQEDIPESLQGNVKNGEQLVVSVGCMGCHQIAPEATGKTRTIDDLHREHGPNLAGTGSKTTKRWLFHWLKDPKKYNPDSKMPNLRLSDQEALDIAEYLMTLNNDKFTEPIPQQDTSILDTIALDFLEKNNTQKEAQNLLQSWSLEKKLEFTGNKLIAHYGCAGCHSIEDFESAKPIGVELTEEASKPLHQFDFGYVDIEHSHSAWFSQKLKDPRSFDNKRIREPLEKLIMPNFDLAPDEISDIVTVLMGCVKTNAVKNKMKPRSVRNLQIEAGQKLVRQYNCQGCHIMENRGGAIEPSIGNWLEKFRDTSSDEANSYSPPNLATQGQKVHAQWLHKFLDKPFIVRPWLKVRMPNFELSDAQLNTLLKYFSALDKEEFPFVQVPKASSENIEKGKVVFEEMQCATCHVSNSTVAKKGLAPSFTLSRERLKPKWIEKWLIDPQNITPGTQMPTYGDILTKEERQHIRDFLLNHDWK